MLDFETTDLSGSAMIALDVAPSTNDLAVEAARAGAEHGWTVRADIQTAGRGRRGHSWHSPKGGLYLSIVLRPKVPMQMLMGLPAVTSLGVLDALEDLGLSGRVGVKWPNDIVSMPRSIATPNSSHFNRKLVGILVEARSSSEGAFAVAGIGLNIAPAGRHVDSACRFRRPSRRWSLFAARSAIRAVRASRRSTPFRLPRPCPKAPPYRRLPRLPSAAHGGARARQPLAARHRDGVGHGRSFGADPFLLCRQPADVGPSGHGAVAQRHTCRRWLLHRRRCLGSRHGEARFRRRANVCRRGSEPARGVRGATRRRSCGDRSRRCP